MSRHPFSETAPNLKEIAGRLKKLSYRDMALFEAKIIAATAGMDIASGDLVEAILKACDEIEALAPKKPNSPTYRGDSQFKDTLER
jgi:hypothetical protein